MPGNGDRDALDRWLAGEVRPLPPPPGTFDLVIRRARRRKIRKLAITVASAAAVAAAAVIAVPGALSLHLTQPGISGSIAANGLPPRAAAPSPGHPEGAAAPLPAAPSPAPAVWPSGPVPPGFDPVSATFIGPDMGWAIGQASTPGNCATQYCTSIVRTDDGGRTWTGAPAPRTGPANGLASGVSGIRFLDGINGWAFGPELWSTHDRGHHWARVNTGGQQVIGLETAGSQAFALFATCATTPAGGSGTGSQAGASGMTPVAAPGATGMPSPGPGQPSGGPGTASPGTASPGTAGSGTAAGGTAATGTSGAGTAGTGSSGTAYSSTLIFSSADCTSFTLERTPAGSDHWTPVAAATTGLAAGQNSGAPGGWAEIVLSAGQGWLLGPDATVYSGSLTGSWQPVGMAPCGPGAWSSAGALGNAQFARAAAGGLLLACGAQPQVTAVSGQFAQKQFIFSSSDGGATWQQQTVAPGRGIAESLTASPKAAILATTSGIEIRPVGGAQWRMVPGTPSGGFSYIGMTTPSQGFAVPADSSLHEIWMTYDGGLTWTPSKILP